MGDIEVEQWTEEGAERLRAAATELAEAVLAHADAVSAAKDGAGFPDVMRASDALEAPIVAYAAAQWDFCGNGYPFNSLDVGDEDDEGDDEDEPYDEDEPDLSDGLVLVERRDFTVQDANAVVAAGRDAYAHAWPDDPRSFAEARVTTTYLALSEILHAHGRDALDDVDGLRPRGSSVVITEHDESFGDDPGEWIDEVLDGPAEPSA